MINDPGPSAGRALPTRIITYAWGEKYLDELLSFAVPALLAPGNVPAVAAAVPCELVILTEERFFSKVLSHRAVTALRALCPLRLIGLDDLVSNKDKYGMALTYALHRGFSDLGAAMTESWLIFLNADFILADGSLRNLLPYLFRGDRLIASPSYCVNSPHARSTLLRNVDPASGALSISPRAMANLILHRQHSTIKAKTVSQSAYHFHYMDQFYWQVDDHTLLGHQMPVAIAAMRPERYVAEPNSYWDYGLMREFCPESRPTVLGDSDEFLMLELREPEVFQELVQPGHPDPKQIGRRMIQWVTPYQREFAQYPLTLHDRQLPADVEVARQKLKSFVDEVLSHCPAILPSHVDHPQWNYHRAAFIEYRHAFLSKRLGSLTETNPPPPVLGELDRTWWLLDGAKKSHARARARILQGSEEQIESLNAKLSRLRADVAERRAPLTEALLGEPTASGDLGSPQALWSDLRLERSSAPEIRDAPDEWSRRYEEWLDAVTALDDAVRLEEGRVARLVQMLTRASERRLYLLDIEAGASQVDLQRQYELLLRRSTASAAIPEIEVHRGAAAAGATDGQSAVMRLAASAYRYAFGKLPRVTRISPYWGVLHPLLQIVDAAVAAGAADGLVVGSYSDLTEDIIGPLAGTQARVSVSGVKTGNFAKAFDYLSGNKPEFDIVVCDLDYAELVDFAEIYEAVRPFLREHGKIVGFHYREDLSALPRDAVDLRHQPIGADAINIRLIGMPESVRALRRYRDIHNWRWLPRPLCIVAALVMAAPLSYIASRATERADAARGEPLRPCTGITIDVTVNKAG